MFSRAQAACEAGAADVPTRLVRYGGGLLLLLLRRRRCSTAGMDKHAAATTTTMTMADKHADAVAT